MRYFIIGAACLLSACGSSGGKIADDGNVYDDPIPAEITLDGTLKIRQGLKPDDVDVWMDVVNRRIENPKYANGWSTIGEAIKKQRAYGDCASKIDRSQFMPPIAFEGTPEYKDRAADYDKRQAEIDAADAKCNQLLK